MKVQESLILNFPHRTPDSQGGKELRTRHHRCQQTSPCVEVEASEGLGLVVPCPFAELEEEAEAFAARILVAGAEGQAGAVGAEVAEVVAGTGA
ncbi:hypothetical protein BSKO_13668 [Bryopsis sp. KO-2023]|nr:hypothetical protein BSKO_13668 [Bryopsis sp. KO-2023]